MASQLPDGEPMPIDGILPEEAFLDQELRTFHAYLHIPFCKVRCGYCDFNTYTAPELRGVKQNDFARVIKEEIALSKLRLIGQKRALSSVFFGGGTPTQLPASDLVELLAELRLTFGLQAGAEVTTEANPDDVSREYLEELKAGGFTRVSFGMQSAVPRVLAILDRTHDPEKVTQVVVWAKEVGLQTSVDLIYGAPTESMQEWKQSVQQAISLEPDHISAYSLIVEPGTKMFRQIKSKQLPEPDEDSQASKYELANELLEAAGFGWYEVSNWSKHLAVQSVHNKAYWNSNDWWGYGPGAHSHVGGVRWWNVKHPAEYAARLARAESPGFGMEILDDPTKLVEAAMLRIRTEAGLPIELLRQLPNFSNEKIASYIGRELIDAKAAIQGHLRLTLNGRLLADSLVRELI